MAKQFQREVVTLVTSSIASPASPDFSPVAAMIAEDFRQLEPPSALPDPTKCLIILPKTGLKNEVATVPTINLVQETITDDGYIAPKALAGVLRITQTELSNITGLRREAVSKNARVRSLSTQKRLRETVEILNRISDWCGGPVQALAWFRSQPLPSFGDLTAEDLLKAGRADALRAYLRRVAEGGYA